MGRGRKKKDEQSITIEASQEEWEAVQKLITSYRRQCRSQRYHDAMLVHLENFQKRLIERTGEKPPEDYMI